MMDTFLDRREFLKGLARLAGGTAAGLSALNGDGPIFLQRGGTEKEDRPFFLRPVLEGRLAAGQIVPQDDSRLRTEYVKYPGASGEVRGYFAEPKNGAKLLGVVIVHENRGLNPHTEDVARRVALQGYVALAPDGLSPLGGTPGHPDEARDMIGKLDREVTTKNYVAAVEYLKTHPHSTGKVGCMGFCWGGGVTNQVAVHSADLKAAVPFYGMQPNPADVPKIKAAMLIHYAGTDERINAGMFAFEAALKKAGVDYKIYIYDGAGHAFFNDAVPERYNKEAAELAWQRTIAFFKEKLKA